MTDFEPILTDEEYETNEKAIATIEARLDEMDAGMTEMIAPHLEVIESVKEKYERVINNLKASLYRHKAASHDYWLNGEMNANSEGVHGGLQDATVAVRGGPASSGDISTGVPNGPTSLGSWQAEVTSLHDLISAAATDPQWEEFLLPNQTKLNARARKDKRAMFIPGCVPVRKEK
jgi:hypothetical protein